MCDAVTMSSGVRFLASACLLTVVATPAGSRAPISCPAGPFIAYFDHGSTKLTTDGRAVLDNAIGQFGFCSEPQAVIVGHTDTSEPGDLSKRRAGAVRAYMIAHRVPRRDLFIRWKGSDRLLVPTPPKTAEAKNRRAEVNYVYDVPAFDAWLSK